MHVTFSYEALERIRQKTSAVALDYISPIG